MLQIREHLFIHSSRWKDQQTELWKAVGKATGWKARSCRHLQISELVSMQGCDPPVMEFLAATAVGKFRPILVEETGQEEEGQGYRSMDRGQSVSRFVSVLCPCVSFSLSNCVYWIYFSLSQGTMGSRWKLRHLAGSPRGGRGFLGSVIL